jgi:type I restriction enzyme S subunit
MIRGSNLSTDLGVRLDDRHMVFLDKELAERFKRSVARRGDLVFTCWGTIGQVGLIDSTARFDEYVVSNKQMKLTPDPAKVDSTFLYYLLGQPKSVAAMLNSAIGSSVPGFNLGQLKAWTVRLPPLSVQRRIAGVLGALDDLIDTNKRLMRSLKDAVTAEYWRLMLGETTPVRLFDACSVDFGSAFKGSRFTEPGDGLPLLRIRDLKTFKSDTWTTERITGDVLVQPGDVVVGMDAEFRSTLWLGAPSLLNQRVCRIRPKIGSLAFIREALIGPLAFIEGHKTGTTVSHLNKGDLEETKLHLPTPDAIAAFDYVAEPMRLAIVSLHQEAEMVGNTRDELLPLLLSGAVTVAESAA